MRRYATPLMHWRVVYNNRTVDYGCDRATPVNSTQEVLKVNCVQCRKARIAGRTLGSSDETARE